jgi:hypothetical protein
VEIPTDSGKPLLPRSVAQSMRYLVILALSGVLLAGCTSEPRDVSLGGTFSGNRTENDLRDFQFTVEPFSKNVAIMESFPEQFRVGDLTRAQCEKLFARLEVKAYMTSLGPCISASNPPVSQYGN